MAAAAKSDTSYGFTQPALTYQKKGGLRGRPKFRKLCDFLFRRANTWLSRGIFLFDIQELDFEDQG
jgi:hypothetical protein